jgi:putative flippase GtrA
MSKVPEASASAHRGNRRTAREIMSFLAVGAAGFAIEAIILTGFTQFAQWSPWQARVPSFLTAVLVTWALNRQHTFPDRGLQRPSLEVLFYAGIQSCGALINLAIFGATMVIVPALTRFPVIPLAVGAVGGFAFNYLVSSKLLYAGQRSHASG